MKATVKYGDLVPVPECTITIEDEEIIMFILPDISDSKGASYNDEPIMGRSFPVKTYSYSENRSISIELHFIALKKEHIERNLRWLRLIQSAVYPRDGQGGAPYRPPPVCQIKCGKLLGDDGVCVVLKNYSVKFPPDQVWDQETLLPYKFDVSTSWEVVYASSLLPGQEMIAETGS
jgi:hypothetical protein